MGRHAGRNRNGTPRHDAVAAPSVRAHAVELVLAVMLLPILAAFALPGPLGASTVAAEEVTAFPGAGPGDVSRGLPASAFAPRLDPAKAFMESYSAWIQLADGATLFFNLPITNLPSPHECSAAIDLYLADGTEVLAEEQFSGEDLKVTPSRVACGGNVLEQVGSGQYRLITGLPRADGKGTLSVDLAFAATITPFIRGDGRVRFGDDGYFEMRLLVPRGTVTGRYQLDGTSHPARGQVYLDYAAQSIWAHELATFWLSYRFFSDELYVASTTLTTPPGYGSRTIHHVTVAWTLEETKDPGSTSAGHLLFATDNHRLELMKPVRDDWSGYEVPGEIRSIVEDQGMRIEIEATTAPHLLSKTYILAPLHPIVRAVISTFIARPYTYRYRARTVARATLPDGSTHTVPGTFVAEMIFVNRP